MDTSKILADLRAERDQINQAIAALESLGGTGAAAKSTPKAAKAASVKAKPKGKKHVISAAGRNRIAEAARKRWAAVRSAKTAPVASRASKRARKPMSAAPKQKPAAAAKERPAESKAKPETSAKQAAPAPVASKGAKRTRRNLTAAARNAMSEAAKARWANKVAAVKTE